MCLVFSSFIQAVTGHAVVRDSLNSLYPFLENKAQFKWILQRIRSMEEIWVEAGRSLSAKYNVTGRKAKHVMYPPDVFVGLRFIYITPLDIKASTKKKLQRWMQYFVKLF